MTADAGVQGFQANAQNVPREDNPFIKKALKWDEGWCQRESQRLVHMLRKKEAENLGKLEFGYVRTSEVKDRD